MNDLVQHTGRRLHPLRILAAAWIFLALILMGVPEMAQAQDKAIESLKETGQAFASVAKGASPAVVYIKIEKSVAATRSRVPMAPFNDEFFRRFFGDPMPEQQPRNQPQQRQMVVSHGSGFIISPDGYILTNNHVVGEADKVTVKLLDGREFTAKTVGTDPPTDVALIKIEAKNLPILPLGDSDRVEVGEWVLALGNPFGLSHTLTAGIVSAKGRNKVGVSDYEDFIQTDAAINPGNSGGPLIDLEGKVVGINTAIYSRNGGYMGIGFAIPVNLARSIYSQLIEHGNVIRGYLGVTIQDITSELAKSFSLKDTKGVLISQVMPDTPAEKAGLKQGDVIVSFNGESVDTVAPLRNKIALTAPGTRVNLGIVRDGKAKTHTVTVEKLSSDAQFAVSKPGNTKKLGLTITPLTKDLATKYGYKNEKGLVITEVNSDSEASRAGIRPGMLIVEVNRKKVSTLKELEQAMKASPDKPVLLLIKDREGSRFIALEAEK